MGSILVTGINGFVGKHLARELYSRGHTVFGVGREDIPHEEISGIIKNYSRCDLTDQQDVAELPLDDIDAVINLAGLARVGDSFKDPDRYNHINVSVLTVLGRRLAAEESRLRLIAISTGAVYDPGQSLPLTEQSRVTTKGSPYATSKLLMEKAADELRDQGVECIVVRPFNHIGPGQESGFLLSDLFEKISNSMKNGGPVEVGNLNTKRDYTDVRDVVKAYADLAEASSLSYDLYNVCSSKSITGQEMLERLLRLMGAEGKVKIEINQSFIRVSDPPELYGSYHRLKAETNWSPGIKLEQTINDFIDSAAAS